MESEEQKLINEAIAEEKQKARDNFKRSVNEKIHAISSTQKQIRDLQAKLSEHQKALKELKIEEFDVDLG